MTHKTIDEVYDQLASVVIDVYTKENNNLLIRTQHGIVVYNKYLIRKSKQNFEIILRYGSDHMLFGSAKNALIWAILDHHTKVPEAKRVKELDSFIHGTQVDCEIHHNLKNKGNTENFLIHSSKLQRDKERQRQFLYEIDKYNIMARKCQQTRTNI